MLDGSNKVLLFLFLFILLFCLVEFLCMSINVDYLEEINRMSLERIDEAIQWAFLDNSLQKLFQ